MLNINEKIGKYKKELKNLNNYLDFYNSKSEKALIIKKIEELNEYIKKLEGLK